ncbi:MAG TPA: DUF4390 domain-containing protein [Vicinamibacterales bacterium]|jgi:hypothetical protein
MKIRTTFAGHLTAALLAVAPIVHAQQESLRIIPTVRDNRVLVSFELNDAYTDAVRDAIASGLRTTFSYELELRTVVPGWIDRTIAKTVVTTSDQFDNLTRRHTLTRTVDGKTEDSIVTEDEALVRDWLTKWSRVQVSDTSKLDATRDYYVHITTRARPLGGSLLGLTKSISGSAKFTFIP